MGWVGIVGIEVKVVQVDRSGELCSILAQKHY